MKKSLFFIPAAALLLASCSNEDFDNNAGNGYDGPTETRYIAVNVVDNGDATRAGSDYEAGTTDENKVNFVRFYLFGEGDFENIHIDCTADPVSNPATSENVEKILHSVIVFEAPAGSDTPIQIVAVVNAPGDLEDSYDSPEELQSLIADYNITDPGAFIMSNSVYVDSDSKEYVGVPVTVSYSSREEALQNPTEIYVERVVAKVRVNTADAMTKVSGQDYYKIMASKNDNYTTSETLEIEVYDPDQDALVEMPVYVKLLGWDVTGVAPKSRLVKKIETSWGTNWNWVWNTNDYKRSFWAENPTDVADVDDLTFGNFKAARSIKGFTTPAADSADPKNFTYLQENAAWDNKGESPAYASKLIVAAQLCDEDGEALDLAWWKGSYYLQEDLLKVFAAESRIYSFDGVNYKPISPDYFRFVSYADLNTDYDSKDVTSDADPKAKRYYSYVQLGKDLANTTWVVKDGQGKYEAIAADNLKAEVNKILKNLDIVKVWSNGYTYYWTDIKHLGNEPYGDKGVVRNHIYDYSLSSFVGLGIPVLVDPDKTEDDQTTIYPEDPEDPEYAFISARINVLSWRIVKHENSQLGWD